MNQNHDVEVSRLFEEANSLPYSELTALCAEISQEHAQAISGAVTDYYASLPEEKRFFFHGPALKESQATQIPSWTNWRKSAVDRRAAFYVPSGYTLLAEEILYKAGTEYWLTWLDSLPSCEQAASLLLNYCGRNLAQAFACACGMESLTKIKSLLFCALVSQELSPSDCKVFLGVIQRNRSDFMDLCLEVLSDFHFQLAYPKSEKIIQSFISIFAGQGAISHLSIVSPMTTGAICAWAELLSQLRPTKEELAIFKSAYIDWIYNTNDYMLTTTIKGGYYKCELKFFEFVAETYVFDEAFEEELKTLLEKKTYVYHGWAPEESPRQQWFLHISLLLWLMGVNRYCQSRDEELVLYVLEKLNHFIPMVLLIDDYSLLLGNMFCIPEQATPEIDAQLICLIRKIYELPALGGIVENYLEHACCSAKVLCAMRDRLQILLELPRRKLPKEPEFPGQELLSRIESALRESE